MNRISTFFVAAVLCAVPAFAAAPNVAALAEAYEAATLGPSAAVSGVTIALTDRAQLTLASGSAANVIAGNGEIIGLFFNGTGSLRYLSTDADETVVTKFAVKKVSDLKLGEDGKALVLSNAFNQLYLRAGAIALPDLSAGGGDALADAWKKHRDEMAKRTNDAAMHMLIKQRLDAPKSPVAVAQMTGADRPAMYYLDTLESKSEGVISFYRNRDIQHRELASYWWPAVVSDQPVGRSRRAFLDPQYLLTALDYTLVAMDDDKADLTVTETILPRGAAQSVYRFDLHSTVYDTSGRARSYNVRSVKDAAGRELSYHHRDGSILVGLPQATNQPFNLRFEIEGNFLYRPNGDSFWQLGTEPWFPQPDLNGQFYTIHSVVKVKKPWVAFAPGVTVRKGEEGEFNVIETKIDKPVQFGVVHAGKYGVSEETYEDGITVRVASYAGHNDRAMKQLNNLAWKMIKFYEPWLGKFPFREFNIIEIHELGYAQAPPATMFITKEAFNPLLGDDNKLFSKGINERFAHEIAHQYWGHVVKMGSGEEQWVTESFAEYSSALAIKKMKGKGAYDSMLATWKANANDAKGYSSIPLANRLRTPGDFAAFVARTHLIYDKGAYLLAKVHKDLGDDKFFTFMRSLQGFHEFQYLTTENMVRLLSKVDGGKDWKPFFEQYYWGTDMPKM